MTRVLMVYGTRQGHTKIITDRIATLLRANRNEVDVRNLGDAIARPDASEYDAVVVGASVHAGAFEREVREWALHNAHALRTRPNAFFSVSLSAAGHDARSEADIDAAIETFVRDTQWVPARIEKFAGALEYSKYNWLVKRIMRRIVRKRQGGGFDDMSHDYDFTDYEQVDAFARAIATSLVPVKGR